MKSHSEIVTQLKAARRASGFTQLDIAKILKRSRPQIANLESGKHNFSLPLFLKYCEIVGVKLSDFCDGETLKTPHQKLIAYKNNVHKYRDRIIKACFKEIGIDA